jgi:hypothetical protein
MSVQDEALEADQLANEVNKLAMLFGKPERFHEIKNDVAVRLRHMARRLRGDGPRKDLTTWKAPDVRR